MRSAAGDALETQTSPAANMELDEQLVAMHCSPPPRRTRSSAGTVASPSPRQPS